MKVLVGVTPSVLTSFVSDVSGGSSSYRQVVEWTTLSLAKFCDPHDSVMSDKGFNVQDIFASRNVHINIPAFFKGRTGWLQQHDKRTEKLPASESMLKG